MGLCFLEIQWEWADMSHLVVFTFRSTLHNPSWPPPPHNVVNGASVLFIWMVQSLPDDTNPSVSVIQLVWTVAYLIPGSYPNHKVPTPRVRHRLLKPPPMATRQWNDPMPYREDMDSSFRHRSRCSLVPVKLSRQSIDCPQHVLVGAIPNVPDPLSY